MRLSDVYGYPQACDFAVTKGKERFIRLFPDLGLASTVNWGCGGMRANIRIINDDTIWKSLRHLYIETDYARRAMYRKVLISDLKRLGTADLRLRALRNCLSDCDGHIVRHRALITEQRSVGVDVRLTEIQLDNLLDVRATLRIELRKTLSDS